MASFPSVSASPSALNFMQQTERFKWFASGIERRTRPYDLFDLENRLHGPLRWPGQREKALVSLALRGDVEAGELIASFDPGDDEILQMFHAICADAWARGAV